MVNCFNSSTFRDGDLFEVGGATKGTGRETCASHVFICKTVFLTHGKLFKLLNIRGPGDLFEDGGATKGAGRETCASLGIPNNFLRKFFPSTINRQPSTK